MLALAEVDKTIISNPTTSIKNVYDQKEIELANKYGPDLVAAYWPEFAKIGPILTLRTKTNLSLNCLQVY